VRVMRRTAAALLAALVGSACACSDLAE